MIIIKQINIKNFRSCKDISLEDIQNISAIAGQNNVGKSNILRAVSLFFTKQIEPGVSFNIGRDCSAKRKKETRITIDFDLPNWINIQKNLIGVEELLSKPVSITKIYILDQTIPEGFRINYEINGEEANQTESNTVDQFLNLFNFRYITADRTAKKVLEENLSELQAELNYRLNKSDKSSNPVAAEALNKIQELSKKIFEPISTVVQKADSRISDVNLSTPDNLAELLRTAKYKLTMDYGDDLNELQQGSGIQSILLFSVLVLIDKNFHRKFGWKVATIWCIEEPEVFLHHNLELQLSNFLSDLCYEDSSRFQIFLTTHSTTFTSKCDTYYNCQILNQGSTEVTKKSFNELISDLQSLGIINAQHMLSLFPAERIILVEGYYDEYVLRKVLHTNGIFDFRIYSIDSFLGDKKMKGSSQLIRLLEGSVHMLQHRNPDSGILAVFDWDIHESEIRFLRTHLKAPNFIYRFDEKDANPELSKEFRGIERFYPTDLVLKAKDANNSPSIIYDRNTEHPQNRYFCESGDIYKKVKRDLFEQVSQSDSFNSQYFDDFVEFYSQNFA